MATLELKDITNLPSSLPISLIPQGQSAASHAKLKHYGPLSHQGPQLQNLEKHRLPLPQQRRVSALSCDDPGCDLMDDSLTDMQWLQRMDAGSDFPGLTHAQCRKKMAGKSNRPMGKDGCRKKLDYSSKKGSNKPPLSYASLIALAICSTPQRMMTLSNIYRWIEYTFPFYRTPEAKAWKNSIRHNLSIRKNMFMKVYQYPPRRGNGSYWTLLSDGEEELKKAVPLFATLQPPVIDSNCAYHREPSTHTVKSKGKFVPVLPRSDVLTGGLPYFSIGSTNLASGIRMSDPAVTDAANEIVIGESSGCSNSELHSGFSNKGKGKAGKRPRHLSDHSYAKSWHQEGTEAPMGGTEVVELAVGRSSVEKLTEWDESIESNESFADLSTPKRKWKLMESQQSKLDPVTSADGVIYKYKGANASGNSPSFTTPPKDQDNSLHLLDASFLTPLKNFTAPDIEIGAISFSPLYANLITPSQDRNVKYSAPGPAISADTPSRVFFPSPLTPLKSSMDSGIFSPLRSDCLGGMKFSTPNSMNSLSPLADLSAFSSFQPELYPLKILDNSEGIGNTPLRLGSLQALGLPGLTPPSRK